MATADTAVISDVFDAVGHAPPILDNRLTPIGAYGVIAIQNELVSMVAAKASTWAQSDSRSREDILTQMPLLEVLEKYGHL